MITLIITLVMAAIVLAIALAVSLKSRGEDDDRRYLDKDGDHVYYNESIIEKKEFRRRHPDADTRTFERLFRKRR